MVKSMRNCFHFPSLVSRVVAGGPMSSSTRGVHREREERETGRESIIGQGKAAGEV